MGTVGAGLPLLVLVERRGFGVARGSTLPGFQDYGLFVDRNRRRSGALGVCFSLQSPKEKKGFGAPPKKKSGAWEKNISEDVGGRVQDVGIEKSALEEPEDDVVPEVVTNRMLNRIALTVGVPLAVGVLFFPLFYYLKVVKKVDVPEWLPLLTSMATFGSAGLGITYGVLSASWDPAREGSLLGWKEAQVNWPVFWETVQGKRGKK